MDEGVELNEPLLEILKHEWRRYASANMRAEGMSLVVDVREDDDVEAFSPGPPHIFLHEEFSDIMPPATLVYIDAFNWALVVSVEDEGWAYWVKHFIRNLEWWPEWFTFERAETAVNTAIARKLEREELADG